MCSNSLSSLLVIPVSVEHPSVAHKTGGTPASYAKLPTPNAHVPIATSTDSKNAPNAHNTCVVPINNAYLLIVFRAYASAPGRMFRNCEFFAARMKRYALANTADRAHQ